MARDFDVPLQQLEAFGSSQAGWAVGQYGEYIDIETERMNGATASHRKL